MRFLIKYEIVYMKNKIKDGTYDYSSCDRDINLMRWKILLTGLQQEKTTVQNIKKICV